MATIILLYLIQVSSVRLLEYQLSKNFGETFHDYTENYREGINGNKIGQDKQDTLPSDRGAYFRNSQSVIVIPETDLNEQKIEFSAPYSIVIWTNLLNNGEDSESAEFLRSIVKRVGTEGDEVSLSISSTMDLEIEVIQTEYNNNTESEDSGSSESSPFESSSMFSGDSSEQSSLESSDLGSLGSSDGSESSDSSEYESSDLGSLGSSYLSHSSESSSSESFESSFPSNDFYSSDSNRRLLRFNRKIADTGIQAGTWILLRLSINQNTIEVFINEVAHSTQTISTYSEVNQNYLTYIGGSPNSATSIDGYVWSLAVDSSFVKEDYIPTTTLSCEFAYYESGEYKCFPTEMDITKNLDGTLCPSNCLSCTSYLSCIECKCKVSSCEIKGDKKLCVCPNDATATETTCDCGTGSYYTGKKCEKCSIGHCLECSGADECLKCETGFEVNDGQCSCPVGQYESEGICKECISNCDTCTTLNTCEICSSNYYLNSQGICQECGENCKVCTKDKCIKCTSTYELKQGSNVDCACPDGYSDIGKCKRNRFEAVTSVSNDNKVTLVFNETLKTELIFSDFIIDSSDIKEASIKFKAVSSAEYQFHVESDQGIEKGSVFNVSVKNAKLTSKANSLYFPTDLAVELKKTLPSNPAVAALKKIAKTVAATSVGVAAVAALASNPGFFWILINTLQIITYLPLNSIPYSETLVEFFVSLSFLNFFPSVTSILGISVTTYPPYLEARRYQIETALFLINVDIIIVQFLLNILLIFLLVLGKKYLSPRFKEKFDKSLKNYKYGYFLRLLTGIYLDFLVFSLVQLRTVTTSVGGVLSTSVAMSVLAVLLLGPFIILFCGYFSKQKIINLNEIEFHEKWGSLYDEFKNNKGFWSTQFYTIFMFRRLFYGIGQVFLNSQLYFLSALNIFGTFLTLVYIFKYLQFKDKGVLACNIIGEVSIMVTMILSLVFLTTLNENIKNKVEVCIMVIVFSCIIIQMCICLLMFIINLKEKLCGRKRALVIPHVMNDDKVYAIDTSPAYAFKSDNSTISIQSRH